MEFAQITLGDLMQTGALGVVVYLFVAGKIYSREAVKYHAKVMGTAIAKDMKQAVKEGIMEAEVEINGKK